MLRTLLLVWAVAGTVSAAHAFGVYDWPYALTDDQGRSLRMAEWRGKPAIVTMEYADCRFICSITLQRLKDVQAAADRQGKDYTFLVISLDPKNDTPEAWTEYRRTRELTRDNWHFVTGTATDTPVIARRLAVHYWVYDGHIMHDFRLLRLDADGRIVKTMDAFDASVDEFVR